MGEIAFAAPATANQAETPRAAVSIFKVGE